MDVCFEIESAFVHQTSLGFAQAIPENMAPLHAGSKSVYWKDAASIYSTKFQVVCPVCGGEGDRKCPNCSGEGVAPA
jgi:hypothetical protein